MELGLESRFKGNNKRVALIQVVKLQSLKSLSSLNLNSLLVKSSVAESGLSFMFASRSCSFGVCWSRLPTSSHEHNINFDLELVPSIRSNQYGNIHGNHNSDGYALIPSTDG